MDRDEIVEGIDAEIRRLEQARALLTGHEAPLKRLEAERGDDTFGRFRGLHVHLIGWLVAYPDVTSFRMSR